LAGGSRVARGRFGGGSGAVRGRFGNGSGSVRNRSGRPGTPDCAGGALRPRLLARLQGESADSLRSRHGPGGDRSASPNPSGGLRQRRRCAAPRAV